MPDPVVRAAATPAPEPPEFGGRNFGPYRLDLPVAVGEIGVVFKGRGPVGDGSERTMAVHLPPVDLQRDEAFQGLYRMDATEARTLKHPNLVTVLDAGRIQGLVFRVHTWYEGWDLASVVRRALEVGRSLDVQQIVSIGLQLGLALVYLHERADLEGTPSPLVHGHVGLPRVLLSGTGQPRLLGLPSPRGRAATGYGRVTNLDPAEMAPEQIRAGGLSARADLYQLGLLMYAMWLGGTPFRRRLRRQTLAAVMEGVGNLQRAERLPGPLRTLLESALSVEPARRPDSARAMVTVLESVLAHAGGPLSASRWHVFLGELFPGGMRPSESLRTAAGIEDVRRLLQILDGQATLQAPEGGPSTLVPESEPESVPAMVEMSAERLSVSVTLPRPAINLPTFPMSPQDDASDEAARNVASWTVEENTELTNLKKLEGGESETEPAAPASVVVGPPLQVSSPEVAPKAAPPAPASVDPVPPPVPAPVPAPAPPGPEPRPPTPRVPRPHPTPARTLPPTPSRRRQRGIWIAVFAVGIAVGLVVMLLPRERVAPTAPPAVAAPAQPPAPEPAPTAPTPPIPAPAPVAAAQPEPAVVPTEAPAAAERPATPPVSAPVEAVTKVAAPAPSPRPPAGKAASAPNSARQGAPVASTAPKSAAPVGAPAVAPLATPAPVAPVASPPSPPEAAPVSPAPAPVASAPSATSAASAHLVDLAVVGAGTSVTVAGRVDVEGLRPVGYRFEAGTNGPQYIVRYKGVAASVSSRSYPVDSPLVRGVRVVESGTDTSIIVDLVPGAALTPKLQKNPTGFLLTLEPAPTPP